MIKKAYSIQMSYDVSDQEKFQAEKVLICLDHAVKSLRTSSSHLNIMKTPFKDNSEINPEELMKARAATRRFRDKAVENFNAFKVNAFKCVQLMQPFTSDTQTTKLVKSFIGAVEDLEAKVNNFVRLFDDLQSKSFSKDIVDDIDKIQAQCKDVETIIDERIKSHIQNHILSKSWVDSVSDKLQMKIEEKTPLMLELFNKRQDQLNETLKDRVQSGT